MSHRLDDDGLCPVCGVAPCREADRVVAGGNVAETRLPAGAPALSHEPSGRTADVDPVAERMYAALIEYGNASAGLGPQANSGP